MNPHAVAQSETADDFRRHENILRCLNKISLRVPQESKAFARNFDDAFAEFRLALNLLAIFERCFRFLQCDCRSSVSTPASSRRSGRSVRSGDEFSDASLYESLTIVRSEAIPRGRDDAVGDTVGVDDAGVAPVEADPVSSGAGWFSFSSFIVKRSPSLAAGSGACRVSCSNKFFQAGNLASNSSGISKFE